MIDINNMTFAYPGEDSKVFQNFNMHVNKGEFVATIGESGCGKTTLMRLIIRELEPNQGRILVAGEDISRIKGNEIYTLRRKIGMVFQDVKLLEDRTVFENLSFCAKAIEMTQKSEFDRITSILKLVGMLDYHKKKPCELSGGQRSKIGIGRALLTNPTVLLCDEPTGNLDPEASQEVIKLLKVIQSQGTSIVLATHDIRLLEKYNINKISLRQEGEI